MEVLKELSTEEKLAVRELQLSAQTSQIDLANFKTRIEAEYKEMEKATVAKSQAVISYLTDMAKSAELKIEEVEFDFETLVFKKKST